MNMSSGLDLYLGYFGLRERPFTLLPDPDLLFWSDTHKRAYTMLQYGLATRAPITLITGEVGAGKTTLLHYLLKTLDDDLTVGLVSNVQGGRGDLLRWVLSALDQSVPPGSDYVDLFSCFQEFLIEEYSQGRRVLLIFDEAQNLDRETLEELRMFSNINSNKDELLLLVLMGQPELRDLIRQPDLMQFAQRVTASFHLSAMDEETVDAYIQHRLEKTGATYRIFSKEACLMIAHSARGIPRLVNQLADYSLVYAASDDQAEVTEETVRNVLKDGVFFTGALLQTDAKT